MPFNHSQVPAPMSEEQENERRAREAEKRKTAKKQRQARQKVTTIFICYFQRFSLILYSDFDIYCLFQTEH